MNIIILTHGLTPQNTRLMPWRYVLEITKGIIATGNYATVITDGTYETHVFPSDMPPVEAIKGSLTASNPHYRECTERIKPDVIYIPIARRSGFACSASCIDGVPHLAYFPSPWYDASHVLKVSGELGFHDVCIYTLESLISGKRLVKSLKRKNIAGIVTVTEYTAQHLVRNGWPKSRVKALPPGADPLEVGYVESEAFKKYRGRLNDEQYLLFMGPPRAIRGIYFLLKAFDLATDSIRTARLVCLLRHSNGDQFDQFKKAVKKMRHNENVVVVEDLLTRDDVFAFINSSRAVALPFLIIPSEIPLAIIETMALGKPVIITETGGSSEFVGKAGTVVPQNDVAALAQSIIEMFSNEVSHTTMCEEAKRIIKDHPCWQDVAQSFLDFTVKVLDACSKQKSFPENS
jgi:phosphatidyl-myo-inositol dimannoside synthase